MKIRFIPTGTGAAKAAPKKPVTRASLQRISDAIDRATEAAVKAALAAPTKPAPTRKTKAVGGSAPDPSGRNAVADAAAGMTVRRDPLPTREQIDAERKNSQNEVLAWIRARRKLQGVN